MATESGGSAFFPTTMKEIEEADTIVSQVRAQHTLGYVSTNTATDGHWRKVEIRVRPSAGSGTRIQARKGYSRRIAKTKVPVPGSGSGFRFRVPPCGHACGGWAIVGSYGMRDFRTEHGEPETGIRVPTSTVHAHAFRSRSLQPRQRL